MERAADTTSIRSEPALGSIKNLRDSTSSPEVNAVNGTEDGNEIEAKQQWRPEETTAYLLKWTNAEITQTRINSVAQLRTRIQDDGGTTRHLFVLHGLPVDYIIALKDMLGIDGSFIQANVGRRSYRPLRKKMQAARAQYDYPEMVQKSSVSPVIDDRQQRAASPDLMDDPPSHRTSNTGDSVILCRASIWLSEKAHVLFLDRPAWVDPTSGVSRGRYKAHTSEKIPDKNGISEVTWQIDSDGNTTTLGDEIPSLETMLYENLRDGCVFREDLLELLEELVINQWGEFLDTLDPYIGSAETTALFWQMSECLERNLEVSRQREKMSRRCVELDAHHGSYGRTNTQSHSMTTEWEALLSRVSRLAQLLSHLHPVVPNVQMPNLETDAGVDVGISVGGGDKYTRYRPRKTYNSNGTSGSPSDENQRSLNRVAYLGGVLLPFSIVSGILAIQEPYGPGGSLFWIFWAVAVPLMFLTLGVIYADSIRKAEVWIEVAASGKSDLDPSESDSKSHTDSAFDVPVRVSTPELEQAVTHSLPVSMMSSGNRLAVPDAFTFQSVRNRAAEPVTVRLADAANETEEDDEDEDEEGEVPDTIVEKRWMNSSSPRATDRFTNTPGGDGRKWRKEELGWMGACATLFQLYKLKKGVPPGHPHRSSSYKRAGPRRARTS